MTGRSAMARLVGALGVMALLGATGCRTTTVLGGAGAPSTPEAALARFLDAARTGDARALQRVWGDEQGPTSASRLGLTPAEFEMRVLLVTCFLRHDQARVVSRGPGLTGRPSFTLALTRGTVERTTQAEVANAGRNRWYVVSVATDPLGDWVTRSSCASPSIR
jgi:hypothetical protein